METGIYFFNHKEKEEEGLINYGIFKKDDKKIYIPSFYLRIDTEYWELSKLKELNFNELDILCSKFSAQFVGYIARKKQFEINVYFLINYINYDRLYACLSTIFERSNITKYQSWLVEFSNIKRDVIDKIIRN